LILFTHWVSEGLLALWVSTLPGTHHEETAVLLAQGVLACLSVSMDSKLYPSLSRLGCPGLHKRCSRSWLWLLVYACLPHHEPWLLQYRAASLSAFIARVVSFLYLFFESFAPLPLPVVRIVMKCLSSPEGLGDGRGGADSDKRNLVGGGVTTPWLMSVRASAWASTTTSLAGLPL